MISLQKILDLSPSQIYPGHGPIIQVQTGGWGVIYIMLLSKYLSTGWPEKNNIGTNEYCIDYIYQLLNASNWDFFKYENFRID